MTMAAKLIVFEGPDGVGKSTLAQQLAATLTARGVRCDVSTFPGREVGTLGEHVYELHHYPDRFGVTNIPAVSLQFLHVAAHLDAITNRILPALNAGRWIVLDRYWWSAWVYGITAGARRETLEAMIAAEKTEWAGIVPAIVFLVRRSAPLHEESMDRWRTLVSAYNALALAEESCYPVYQLDNEGSVAETVQNAMHTLEGLRFRMAPSGPSHRKRARNSPRVGMTNGQRDLFSRTSAQTEHRVVEGPSARQERRVPEGITLMAPAKPSEVYSTYWRFAAERQAIFFRRIERVMPLTEDPILSKYKFCNVYRASDRVSQFLIRNVIYQHDQSPEEIFFRTILFKLFNKIETWELLEKELGTPTYAHYHFNRFSAVLDRALNAGQAIYSAAYIMPSGSGEFEGRRKHQSHLKLLERMMQDSVPSRLCDSRTMHDAFNLIRSYPMMGDFLAYQYVTDLNYSSITAFSENEFVVPGPGARDGIRKCFLTLGGLNEADIIRWITEHQQQQCEHFGIEFRSLWGRPLQLIDCQNLFCEVDKYARIAHPDVVGINGRTRIKQIYRRNPDPICYWFPPKWGINRGAQSTRVEGSACGT
jgi:thymidylate kinase